MVRAIRAFQPGWLGRLDRLDRLAHAPEGRTQKVARGVDENGRQRLRGLSQVRFQVFENGSTRDRPALDVDVA